MPLNPLSLLVTISHSHNKKGKYARVTVMRCGFVTAVGDIDYSDPWYYCWPTRRAYSRRMQTERSHFYVTAPRPGARLTKAYDVTIQRYRNSHAKTENGKMHILRCMGSKFCAKFQRCPLKFHTKFWTYTPQNMHFTSYQKFDDLWYLRVMTS